MEGNTVLLDAGTFTDDLELIDVKNGGSTIKKINKQALDLLEGENLTSGILYSKNKNLYFNTNGNVKEINVQSLKTATNFKREITGFPISTNYEHNEQNQQLRLVTNYTNYLSIDLKRMVVERNILLTSAASQNTEINFCNSGDTIFVNEYVKVFLFYKK